MNTGWRMIWPSGRPALLPGALAGAGGKSMNAITPMASTATTASAR